MEVAADLRYGLRGLLRRPLLPAAGVVSLALAIGAGTAVFALVDAILLDPLPVAEPRRLVAVFTEDEANAGGAVGGTLPVSHPNFEDLRDQNTVLSGFAAYQTVPVTLTIDGRAEEVPAQIVSADFFAVLGVEAVRGRTFDPARSDRAGGDPVAVIGYGLSQRRFGGAAEAVGSTLVVNGGPLEIVGVTPPGFTGVGLIPAPELWLPMSLHDRVLGPFRAYFDERRALLFNTVGRLAPGVTAAQARQELTTLARRLAEVYPEANRGRSISLLPVAQATIPPDLRGAFVTSGAVLAAAVAVVLLIAGLNVANLLLVRAAGRSGEIAVRLALGAPRGRLARQMAAEGLLMAIAGGALGLGVAYPLRGLLWANRPPLLAQSAPDLSFDLRVVGFALLLSLATGALFSLAPAVVVRRSRALAALRARAEGGAEGSRRTGLREAIVVGQIGLGLVALVGSGLFLGSMARAQRIDPGFDSERLGLVTVNLGAQGYDEARGRELLRRLTERLEAQPAVASAAVGANVPLSVFGGLLRSVERPGETAPAGQRSEVLVNTDMVGAGYFETLGVPIVRGSGFDGRHREDGVLVAVVNETMARRWWPGADAIGRRFRFYGEEREREVIGVARDCKYLTLGEGPTPYIYLPLAQTFWDRPTIFVRARAGDAAAQLAAVRAELHAVDPALPLIDPTTMSEIVGRSLWAPRLGALLLGVLGLVSLVLATVGTYGVMAMAVADRRHEIGLRMALGADRGRVVRQVLRRGMLLVGLGVALGLAAAFLLARFAAGVLYGFGGGDIFTFAASALVLAAAAFVANLVPARRATRVDPVTVLRSE